MSGPVRLAVAVDRCIGLGQCGLREPEVFRLADRPATPRVVEGPPRGRGRAAG